MSRKVCRTCGYWAAEYGIRREPEFAGGVYIDECRRHAPTDGPRGTQCQKRAWPLTLANDWCGDWKPQGVQ